MKAVFRALETAFESRLNSLTLSLEGICGRTDMIANIQEAILESQNISIMILVIFAGVLFFGSILNASLVSMAERMREIATLRVLGYNPWQIGGLMLRESMLVDLLGTTLGLPLGYLLYLLMAAAYDMELIRLPVVVPPWVWIWTVVLAIASLHRASSSAAPL